jgi:hypothetical protein
MIKESYMMIKIIKYEENMAMDWQKKTKSILKSELKRKNIGYKELAEKLKEMGIEDSERNIANKLARGTFTAVFFIQCLAAIGCHTLHLNDIHPEPHNNVL